MCRAVYGSVVHVALVLPVDALPVGALALVVGALALGLAAPSNTFIRLGGLGGLGGLEGLEGLEGWGKGEKVMAPSSFSPDPSSVRSLVQWGGMGGGGGGEMIG